MPAFRTALLKESDIAHGLDRLPGLAYLCRFQRYEVEFDLIGYERNSVRNALETELSTTRGFRLDGDLHLTIRPAALESTASVP